jgi:hypothetical protein
MPMMAAGLRVDTVNPNMANSTEQSFYVFSPRLIFRSEFVTHEAIVLQYSYYKYGARNTPIQASPPAAPPTAPASCRGPTASTAPGALAAPASTLFPTITSFRCGRRCGGSLQ